MQEAVKSFDLLSEMIREGNPNSVTDAAVGVLATRACIRGAFLNVRVNVRGLNDKSFTEDLLTRGGELERIAAAAEEELIRMAAGSV
jgi:formiminotetrahydrofolate cyclodeaminase